jgi:hypothetical protein
MLGYGRKEFGGDVLAGTAAENVGDLIMGGRKPLHLSRRLEAFHDPLSSSGRLVGVLRPVVEMGCLIAGPKCKRFFV